MSGTGRPLHGKAWRFAVVGVLNSAIDFAAFAALAGLGLWPLLANALAWAIAVTFSFAVNSRWTFERARTLGVRASFARFAVSGAAISLGTSSLAVALLPPLTGLLPAKIIGILVGAVLNFFAARWSIERRFL
ncbi:GtrA family protein [Chelativorans intermedius]|uniref:GtrA family protein n=1 Tax=Chelativorans intermedius TaxID=515947 RepID=A0ABV6D8P4_9HYPH|nr:GtrA family protein [Chelativorans intermedius]MCT8998082.1 GtrA family protein [Chelativorans intermedius]